MKVQRSAASSLSLQPATHRDKKKETSPTFSLTLSDPVGPLHKKQRHKQKTKKLTLTSNNDHITIIFLFSFSLFVFFLIMLKLWHQHETPTGFGQKLMPGLLENQGVTLWLCCYWHVWPPNLVHNLVTQGITACVTKLWTV